QADTGGQGTVQQCPGTGFVGGVGVPGEFFAHGGQGLADPGELRCGQQAADGGDFGGELVEAARRGIEVGADTDVGEHSTEFRDGGVDLVVAGCVAAVGLPVQFGRVDAEGGRDSGDERRGGDLVALLDLGDVGSGAVGTGGQSVLGEAAAFPRPGDAHADGLAGSGGHGGSAYRRSVARPA